MKVHFVGVGGSGISGVYSLAQKMGYEVSGCDLEAETSYLNNILKGHDEKHIGDADLVVVSPALLYKGQLDSEVIKAQEDGKLLTWQEFLGKFLVKDKKLICVAGTHGKSTTTAMLGKLLVDAGLDPTVLVGAKVPEWGGNMRFGKGDYFVLEADEFNDNFLHFTPDTIILNNIEFDHPDYFKSESSVFESFQKFLTNLTGEKKLIVNWENEGLKKLDLTDFNPIKVDTTENKLDLKLKLSGFHNLSNALMVAAFAQSISIPEELIKKSLHEFKGIGRRMEKIGQRGGITIFDDYAHHPTAIKATLEGLRGQYPDSKILAVIEPHGYRRTKALLSNYNGVFDNADKVIVGPIFKARDAIDETITPELVVEASAHKNAESHGSYDELIKNLKLQIKNYDVIIVMGAGKSYIWAREIVELFPVTFSELTTFGVGGEIANYWEVKNKEDLVSKVKSAKSKGLEIFILGGGSDILVSDAPFPGVVIKYTGQNINIEGDNVMVEGGVIWDDLCEAVVQKNLQGIECLSGIPGTVGAAPIQNIGAYGQEIKNTLISLIAYDIEKEKFVTFKNEDCKFSYRDSIFKEKSHWQKYIIIEVSLKLNLNRAPDIKYESLANYLACKNIKNPTLKDVRNAILAIRSEKFEEPDKVGNSGSFFKNPTVTKEIADKLKSEYPDMPIRENNNKMFKISAGFLIESAGFKGQEYGGAGVSPKHALVLINREGKAKAQEVLDLSEKIIAKVYEKFGVELEREVQLINFN